MFFCVHIFPFLLWQYPRVEWVADNIRLGFLRSCLLFSKMSVLFYLSSLSAWESQLLKTLLNTRGCCLVFSRELF